MGLTYVELGVSIQDISHWDHSHHGFSFSVFNPTISLFLFVFIILKIKGVRHNGATHSVGDPDQLCIGLVTNVEDVRVTADKGKQRFLEHVLSVCLANLVSHMTSLELLELIL
ncbi:hypothetical protein HG530_005563 [Fusarium avenaceum]|nr:hypothetical protein HG530_005563 [Fusarium avenaceum]